MATYKENRAILHTEEIIQALRDLACFSQNISGVSADLTQSPSVSELLDLVLKICHAQRGACSLRFPYNIASKRQEDQIHTTSPALDKSELEALRAANALTLTDFQVLEEHPTYLIWLCPIRLPANKGDKPLMASFLIGWDHASEQKERARQLLQQVGEGIQAALATLVLAEHVRELEETVQRRSLQKMELLKAELLASVSHELRSPLSSIQGYTSTLIRHDRRISREERHEFLQAVAQAGQRLERVVDHLLELSLHETGKVILQIAPIHLTHLIRESIIAAESRLQQEHPNKAPGSNITFRLTLASGTQEPVIQADRRRLREVLDQLLENALLYSPMGGEIEIGVRIPAIRNAVPQEKMAEIWVADQGIGIAPQHQAAIFDRFYRVDTRLTREVSGLGLGLALCKSIVELHGGTIQVESQEERGSVFSLTLPIAGPKQLPILPATGKQQH